MSPSTALAEKRPERVASQPPPITRNTGSTTSRTVTITKATSKATSPADLEDEAVVGGTDPLRQLGAKGRVVEVVVHVGEDGAPRRDAGDPLERPREVGVGRMRLAAQRV